VVPDANLRSEPALPQLPSLARTTSCAAQQMAASFAILDFAVHKQAIAVILPTTVMLDVSPRTEPATPTLRLLSTVELAVQTLGATLAQMTNAVRYLDTVVRLRTIVLIQETVCWDMAVVIQMPPQLVLQP